MPTNAIGAITGHEANNQAANNWYEDGPPAKRRSGRRDQVVGYCQAAVIEDIRKESDQSYQNERYHRAQ